VNKDELRREQLAAKVNEMFASAPNLPDRGEASVAAFVGALWEAWRRYPDQRIGQLLINAGVAHPTRFYAENESLTARLLGFARQAGSAPQPEEA
jgi:hypothetical protein